MSKKLITFEVTEEEQKKIIADRTEKEKKEHIAKRKMIRSTSISEVENDIELAIVDIKLSKLNKLCAEKLTNKDDIDVYGLSQDFFSLDVKDLFNIKWDKNKYPHLYERILMLRYIDQPFEENCGENGYNRFYNYNRFCNYNKTNF